MTTIPAFPPSEGSMSEGQTTGSPPVSTPSQRETREVHNHGTEDGPGLACRERMVGGRLVGDCLAPSEAGGREEAYRTARDIFAEGDFDAVVALIEDRRALESLRARLASRPTGEDSARAEVEAERDRLAKQCDQWEEDNRVLAFNARRQLQAVQQEVERIKALKPDYTAPEEYHRAVREKAADILAAIARASEGSPS